MKRAQLDRPEPNTCAPAAPASRHAPRASYPQAQPRLCRAHSFRALRRRWLLALSIASLAGCRRAEAPTEPPAVCVLALPEHLRHTNPDALPAAVWYELLFKGYRDGIGDDPVDCSGEPISWSPLPSSCLEKEAESRVLERKLDASSDGLVVRHAGGEYWFGWAPFTRFADGLSEGPIAIVRRREGKLEARAIGTLRAYPKRARLEVRKLGGQHILVAEGELCQEPGHCARSTRLMWLDRQHFRVRPLRSATLRSCLGPAWFPHTEVIETRLSKRWSRTVQRDVSLAFQDRRIDIDEHIVVNDRDVEQAALPPRLFREAQAQIRLTLEAGEFISEGQSLWNAIRIEDGSTQLGPEPRATP